MFVHIRNFSFFILLLFLNTVVFAESNNTAEQGRIEVWPIVRSSDSPGTLEAVLAEPLTDGVIFYVGIARLLKPDRSYDWNLLDSVFEACRASGKPLKLALLGGRWVPQWLYDDGAQRFSWTLSTPFVDAGTHDTWAPVPWDDVYLTQMEDVAKAVAERYGDNPVLTTVQVTGPSLANGLEMNLNISAAQAQSIGYTPEKLIGAWTRMLNSYVSAFPKQRISLALHNQIAGERSGVITEGVLGYAAPILGGRLSGLVCYATYEPWFNRGNTAVDLWLNMNPEIRREVQLIDLFSAKSVPPADVVEAVLRSEALGAERVEVFALDVLNPDYSAALRSALGR